MYSFQNEDALAQLHKKAEEVLDLISEGNYIKAQVEMPDTSVLISPAAPQLTSQHIASVLAANAMLEIFLIVMIDQE